MDKSKELEVGDLALVCHMWCKDPGLAGIVKIAGSVQFELITGLLIRPDYPCPV